MQRQDWLASVVVHTRTVPPRHIDEFDSSGDRRMQRRDWLALVAVHSDAWLLSVAFYYGARLDAAGRARLFKTINTGPTLFEIVMGQASRLGGAGVVGQPRNRKEAVRYLLNFWTQLCPQLKYLMCQLFSSAS